MLIVANKLIMLSVVLLNVVMLNLLVPFGKARVCQVEQISNTALQVSLGIACKCQTMLERLARSKYSS
jgi:hypothetical protein